MTRKDKKFTQVQETTLVDNETGEIKKEAKVTVMKSEREPDFVKLYLDDITKLNDLPNSSSSVMHSILRRMGYNNEVVLIQVIKKDICEETGLKMDTVNKRISELKGKGILLKRSDESRSVYLVSPMFFAKGKWEDIKKIRLSIEYSKDGRTIKADFDKQQELEFEDPND